MTISRRRALQALGAAGVWPHAATGVAPALAPPSLGLAADFDPASAVWLSYALGHDGIAPLPCITDCLKRSG